MKRRAELVEELEPLRMDDAAGHPWAAWADGGGARERPGCPGAPSRWSGKKDLSWVPLRPGAGGARWRTTTWRATGSGTPPSSAAGGPTATPESCTYAQLEEPVRLRPVRGAVGSGRVNGAGRDGSVRPAPPGLEFVGDSSQCWGPGGVP